MYKINDKSIATWGLHAGTINGSVSSYAIEGAWSLPKRLGETYRSWEGKIEPYVEAEDIRLAGREMTLNLCCTANSPQELRQRIVALRGDLTDDFVLSHQVLGSFKVGMAKIDVETHVGRWAQLVMKLRESKPNLGVQLPQKDNGTQGIDGYSWEMLGMVVPAVTQQFNVPEWAELAVTRDPRCDAWLPGYRQPDTIAIQATITAPSYQQFATIAARLQTLFSEPGTRTICTQDGARFEAFCVDGFTIDDMKKIQNIHQAKFQAKLIVI